MRTRRYANYDGSKKGISEDGNAMAEFALVVGVFLFLFFAIIDFSRLMFMYHHLGNAAREGTRYAIVHGSTSLDPADEGRIQTYVRSITPLDPERVEAHTTWPDGKDPGDRVIVRVDYTFTFTLPVWFGSGIPLSSTSQMVISY